MLCWPALPPALSRFSGAGQASVSPPGQDWLLLRQRDGCTALAYQQVEYLPPATWPNGPYPQMLHLDLTVPTAAELGAAHQRALALGA